MLMVRTKHGVCSACVYELTCAHPRDLEIPPLECAEFELGLKPDCLADAVRPAAVAAATLQIAPDGFKGICVNCDERATCTYPKPEGGVWRCEEYR